MAVLMLNDAPVNLQLNLAKIEERLFESARYGVLRDYGIRTNPQTPFDLIHEVIETTSLPQVQNPLEQIVDNRTVFEAAVRAFGTNGRRWSVFVSNEKAIRKLLIDYRPTTVCAALMSPRLSAYQLRALMPGQSCKSDVEAIFAWARLLSRVENYYNVHICGTAHRILDQDPNLPVQLLMAVIVGRLACCPVDCIDMKRPGMGHNLVSLLLRNLGWCGFRPNKQIDRMFAHWQLEKSLDIEADVHRLRSLVELEETVPSMFADRLRGYLRSTILGIAITPTDRKYIETDTLVSLLAKYVELRGSESDELYFCR